MMVLSTGYAMILDVTEKCIEKTFHRTVASLYSIGRRELRSHPIPDLPANESDAQRS